MIDYGSLNGYPVTELERVRLAHLEVPFPGGGQSYREPGWEWTLT